MDLDQYRSEKPDPDPHQWSHVDPVDPDSESDPQHFKKDCTFFRLNPVTGF
jgi:hypothetical protein